MRTKYSFLSAVFVSAALPILAPSAASAMCTVATAKQSVSSNTLCACDVVSSRMLKYIRRRADFESILEQTLLDCPAFAAVLTDIPTASIGLADQRSGDGSDDEKRPGNDGPNDDNSPDGDDDPNEDDDPKNEDQPEDDNPSDDDPKDPRRESAKNKREKAKELIEAAREHRANAQEARSYDPERAEHHRTAARKLREQARILREGARALLAELRRERRATPAPTNTAMSNVQKQAKERQIARLKEDEFGN